MKGSRRLADRLLTVATIAAVPVLLVSLWRMGEGAIDQLHQYTDRRARKVLVDSVITAGRTQVIGGSLQARHIYIEILDYQCPYCRQADSLLQRRLSQRADLGVVALQLPLTSIHPLAKAAAIAAICANRQGVFGAFHHALYTRGIPEKPSEMWQLARASGAADSTSYLSCLSDADVLRELDRESSVAKRLNVVGTPTFIDRDGAQVPLELVLRQPAGK